MMEPNDEDKPLREETDDIPAGATSEEAAGRDAEVQSVATTDMELPLPESLKTWIIFITTVVMLKMKIWGMHFWAVKC